MKPITPQKGHRKLDALERMERMDLPELQNSLLQGPSVNQHQLQASSPGQQRTTARAEPRPQQVKAVKVE